MTDFHKKQSRIIPQEVRILNSNLKKYLWDLFERYKKEFSSEIPEDFLLHHLSCSFADAVKWWMMEDTKHSPEEVASFYMAMLDVVFKTR